MAISKARRKFIQVTGLAGAGLAASGLTAYSYHRGVRFPSLAWEPPAIANRWSIGHTDFFFENVIASELSAYSNGLSGVLRAYAPQPKITVKTKSAQTIQLVLHNIFPDAQLIKPKQGQISEKIDGIKRYLTINSSSNEELTMQWQLPTDTPYSFAAIGDTGGGKELAWCIKRAGQLGARFLLHLGDFNYQAGDYTSTISLLNSAPLPCFVSIGNHDFHDGGLVYDRFLKEIGPLNHQFSIGKTRFINIDTAANTFPYSAGHRGNLMQTAVENKHLYTDTVAFTHRPLHDPLEDGTHDIGSEGERDWLVGELKKSNINTLLSGHLHIFDRRTVFGIDNIIVGQGLGHQDLITNSDYSRMALGQVDKDGRVSYQFPNLAMPMIAHCHPRTERVKKALRGGPYADLISKIDSACGK